VPNWASKPSIVRVRVGRAMTPALLIKILILPPLRTRNSSAASRTLASDARSKASSSILPSKPASAFSAFFRSRAAANTVAPVLARIRTISTPMPAEAPVMRITLSARFPSRLSSLRISKADGRLSVGPLGDRWAVVYLFVDGILRRDFESGSDSEE